MSLLDRVFAGVYDRILEPSEVRGLADLRRELLAPLTGRVVEIGAGTGLNLPHWPDGVTDILVCEPVPAMVDKLRPKVDDDRVAIVTAPGEAIPADDASVDAVVSTLVLCTVDDVDATLAEVARVLRPGGVLALLEHVAGDGRLHAVQRVVEPAWKVIARGCHLTRDPRTALVRHGFDVDGLQTGRLPGSVALTEPMVHGRAVRTG